MSIAAGRALAVFLLAGLVAVPPAAAAESEVSMTLLPSRVISVDGDRDKFRAQHWMNDGYAGGIEDYSAHYSADNGSVLFLDGRALYGQNDAEAGMLFKNPSIGFTSMEYSTFRKWYDPSGGVFRRFSTRQTVDTDRDLHLDIGKGKFEGGLTLEGLPPLSFSYEHERKAGVKSRLTWASVTEVGEARKIGPSWSEVDEKVDSFTLKAEPEIAGFNLLAQQSWEFVRSEGLREEKQLSTNATASESKVRRQDVSPEADLMTTLLGGERHFLNDKLFVAGAYRFARLESQEIETIIETNAAGIPTNFSNPEQKRNARGDNKYRSHTWTQSTSYGPWHWLQLVGNFKSEIINRASNSSYPADASPSSTGGSAPNDVIDQNVVSLNNAKAVRFGEGLAFRLFVLPRTSLYSEFEFEQSKTDLSEDRKDQLGVNAGETFNRETIADVDRATFTVGGRTSPCRSLDATAQVRHRIYNNDYDDLRETDSTGTAARSAFFDGQRVITDEVSVRNTWKPVPWLRPSVRYQYREDDYSNRAEAQIVAETRSRSHVYTVDLACQPVPSLSTLISFSRQLASFTTPARYDTTANVPAFNANVTTYMANADYTPASHPRVSLSGSALYSCSDNFNDFASTGLPLGEEFERLDLTGGIKWSPREDSSIGLEYAFYKYNSNDNVESGDYTAHAVWLEATKKF